MNTATESTFFLVDRQDSIAHVVLNRPQKANGMNDAFWEELPRIMRELDADPAIRVVVLSGAGRHFSGGMDLAAFQGIAELLNGEPARAAYALRRMILRLQDSFTAIEQCRMPVIAAIHGACLGGAIDMITACDIRLASADASFGIEEIQIGMPADVGTLQRLPRLVPVGIVKELAYTGRRFSAQEALAWGMVNSVHGDREATLAAAMSLAETIAAKSPIAIAGIKRSIDYAMEHTIADGLDQIATWNAGMLRPQELMSALQARASAREAVFADLLSNR